MRYCSLFKRRRRNHLLKLLLSYASSISSGIYEAALLVYGASPRLQWARRWRITLNVLSWLLRLVFLLCFIVDAAYQNVDYLISVWSDRGSLLDVVELLYYLTVGILELEAAIIIFLRLRQVQQMTNGRRWSSGRGCRSKKVHFNLFAFVLGCLLNGPQVMTSFIYETTDEEITYDKGILLRICNEISSYILVPALLLYLQCLAYVEGELRAIGRITYPGQADLSAHIVEMVVERKSHIRSMIATMNRVFKRFIFVKFVSVFCSVTLQVGLTIAYPRAGLGQELSGIVTDALLKLVEIFFICRFGTMLERNCHETERRLYEGGLILGHKEYRNLRRLRRELAFNASRDSLEMWLGFQINLATLIAFFSTIITCCAVSLQFDLRVVRAINNAMRNSSTRS